MIELGRNFGRNLSREIIRLRINWFAVSYFGGVFLAAGGCDHLNSGEFRFDTEVSKCVKVLKQLDPPVYSLKNPTNICVRLDQGVSPKVIIAELEEQAQNERPLGLAMITVGSTVSTAALFVGFGVPILRNAWKRRQEYSES